MSVSSVVQKSLAYARLLRLSNGPTAVADVWMGYAVVSGSLEPTWPLALMTLASLCLYHAGMVGNDLADAFDDRAEGRDRPIARGDLRARDAKRLRAGLEFAAIALAGGASWVAGRWAPLLTVAPLLGVIRLYNSRLKRTLAGPPLMGACRGLNVALGGSVAGIGPGLVAIAVGIAAYIDGVTLYARDERRPGRAWSLIAGASLAVAALAWLAATPRLPLASALSQPGSSWLVAWAVVALFATRGMAAAILQPTPRNIGRGVGIAIQGLVVIDATLAAFYAGPVAGLAILALLPLTMLLARWIPQT